MALGDDLLVIPCPIRPYLFCFLLVFFFLFLFFGDGDGDGGCFFLPRPPFFFVSPVPPRFLVLPPPPTPSHAMAKAARAQ